MKNRTSLVISFVIFLLVCSALACSSDAEATETSEAKTQAAATEHAGILLTATVITWTPSPTASDTPTPTNTFTPSLTFTPSDTYTPSATFTPSNTPKPTNTRQPRLSIIENVETRGGVEVFPEPDRSSGRLFAAVSNFRPHVAGRTSDKEWIFILYFDGEMQSGWSPRNNLVLTESQVNGLTVVNPERLPPLPNLAFNEMAARPYGVNANVVVPTSAPTSPPVEQASSPVPQQQVVSTQVSPTQLPVSNPPAFTCNCSKTCEQMASCSEAYFQLNQCGCGRRDADNDGVPCENICSGG